MASVFIPFDYPPVIADQAFQWFKAIPKEAVKQSTNEAIPQKLSIDTNFIPPVDMARKYVQFVTPIVKAFLLVILVMLRKRKKTDLSHLISPPHHCLEEKRSCGVLESEADQEDKILEAVKMVEMPVKMKSKVEEVLTKLKELDAIETRLMEVSSRLSDIEKPWPE